MQSTKIEWLDSLRVFATFAVILVHVSHPLTEQIHHPYWWVANLYDSAARFCVPIFLMLSGALLLKKQEDLKSFFSKRMTRILIPFLFWNTVYIIVNQYFIFKNTGTFSPIHSFIKAYLKGASFHFWYVYMILGLYLFIPILSAWVSKTNQQLYLYFIGLWIVTLTVSCMPPLYQSYFIEMPYFSGFVGYLSLGYWLSIQKTKRNFAFIVGISLFILGVVLTFFATEWISLKTQSFDHQFYNYCTLNVGLTSTGIFLMVKNLPPFSVKIWVLTRDSIAKYSYGIYLIHILVLDRIVSLTSIDYTYINPIIGIPLTAFVCFVISYVLINIVNRFPYGRHFSG